MSFLSSVKSFSRSKRLFLIVIVVLWLIGNIWLSGVLAALSSFVVIIVLGATLFFVSLGILRLFGIRPPSLGLLGCEYAFRFSVIVATLIGLSGAFLVYQNELSPATVPWLLITNGERAITIQGMAHIASSDFYDRVRGRIATAKQEGYTLFYEGVSMGSGTQADLDTFDRLLGVRFSSGMYDCLAELSGLVPQDQERFLGLVNDHDQNVDLTIPDILRLYQEDFGSGSTTDISETEPVDLETLLITASGTLNPRERTLLAYTNRAIMNFLIKSEWLRSEILDSSEQRNILSIILGERDRTVVDAVVASPERKIFLLYGLLHVNGILERLQVADPRYRVVYLVEDTPLY